MDDLEKRLSDSFESTHQVIEFIQRHETFYQKNLRARAAWEEANRRESEEAPLSYHLAMVCLAHHADDNNVCVNWLLEGF